MRAGIASVGDGSTHSDRDEYDYEYEIYMSREEKNEKHKKNE